MQLPSGLLVIAQALPLGGQQRVAHCGSDKSAVVYHKDEGWSLYCHRCGEPHFTPRPQESLSERVARLDRQREQEASASSSIVPPLPPVTDTSEWPLGARVWLYSAGFSNDDIARLGIYYHAGTDRVVVPVIDEHGVLVCWQARAYDWTRKSTRPKYLNPWQASTAMGVWFNGDGPRVLTEDYLSAYRVHRAGFASATLLGTKLSDKVLARLMNEERPVLVWLDDDEGRYMSNPGQEAAATVVAKLRALGMAVRNVRTPLDPKKYSRRKIAELLKEYQ